MNFFDLISQNLLFDSHCHLNAEQFDTDRDEVIGRAEKARLKAIVDMGIDLVSSKKAIANSEKYDIVYAAVGVDPEILIPGSDLFDEKVFELDEQDFGKWLDEVYQELKKLADNPKVLMIGETGMDNYWLTKNEELGSEVKNKSLDRQEKLFRMHCKLSKELGKPMSIHSRNAINKCLSVLEDEKIPAKLAVFHSLTLDIEDDKNSFENKVSKILNKGYYIGINGIITFKNAKSLRDVYNNFFEQGNANLTMGEGKVYFTLDKLYKSGFLFGNRWSVSIT